MAYKKRTFRKKPMMRRRKAGVVKRAVKRARKTVFNRRVRSVISRMAETKVINYTASTFGLTGVGSTQYTNTIKTILPTNVTGGLLSSPTQGTGQGSRVGNKIMTKKLIMSGVLRINTLFNETYNYNSCPLYIAFYAFKLKSNLDDTPASAYNVVSTSFFQAGNSSQGFNGTLVDLTRQVNAQTVTLLKKRVFYVGTSQVISGFGSNNANVANQNFADNGTTISKMFRMDMTKLMPKTLEYNDLSSTPSNRNVWIMWVPLRVDGNLIVTSLNTQTGPIPAYLDYQMSYEYKDM